MLSCCVRVWLASTSISTLSMAQDYLLGRKWFDEGEKRSFLRAIRYGADSTRSSEQLLRDGIHPLLGNQSNSTSLVEMTQYSEDAWARDNPNCFVACPTVSVSIGDFLGVLPGRLRYQNFPASRKAVPGPCDVWLDTAYYEAPLNQMRTATSGEDANIALCCEAVKENGGSFCDYWRVRVHAGKSILLYEPLIRDGFH